MFEFFIALFGGLYYAGKYAKDKAGLRSYDRRMSSWESTYEYIKSRYSASYELEEWAKDFISSGEHFDEICDWFKDDFEYVLGSEWKTKLNIPQMYRMSQASFNYLCSKLSSHVMWVYHLLLAKKGKIDHMHILQGYPVGGIDTKDMTIKFIECIERNLIDAGIYDVRFAFELEPMCGEPVNLHNPHALYGGRIKLESLCSYPTCRLWKDYKPR